MTISAEGLALGHRYEHSRFGGAVSCFKCNEENGYVNLDCRFDDLSEEED